MRERKRKREMGERGWGKCDIEREREIKRVSGKSE